MKALNYQSSLDAFHEMDLKEEQKLEAVYERAEEGCREAILLKFSQSILELRLDADHDTIDANLVDAQTFESMALKNLNESNPWSSVIDRSFAWGWVTVNQQGYQDGVLLSFDGFEPSIALIAVASSIRVYAVTEVPEHRYHSG